MAHNGYSVTGCALFIDIENVIGKCTSMGIKIKMQPVCDKLTEICPLRYRKSFGDITKSCFAIGLKTEIYDIRKDLTTNLVEIQDIPYTNTYKNSADINIVTTAMSLAYENPHITHFAVLSTDRDFVPLYSKLKELGKTVIIISIDKMQTSPIIAAVADHLIYYETLNGIYIPLQEEVEENPLSREDVLTNDHINLVIRACRSLIDSGNVISGSRLLTWMRQLRSDFDYKSIGFPKFIDFLKYVEKKTSYIIIHPKNEMGGDINITLNEEEIKDLVLETATVPELDSNVLANEYIKYLEDKLKCKLLPIDLLATICSTIEHIFIQEQKTFNSDSDENYQAGIRLKTLSEKVCAALEKKGYDISILNTAIFKVHLSLYYSRAFHIVANASEALNPTILSFTNSPPDLYTSIMHHYLVLIAKSQRFQMSPEAFSLLFYNDTDEAHIEIFKSYISDVSEKHNLNIII
jgi:uncharacterized LabA/DUF88 family protein